MINVLLRPANGWSINNIVINIAGIYPQTTKKYPLKCFYLFYSSILGIMFKCPK